MTCIHYLFLITFRGGCVDSAFCGTCHRCIGRIGACVNTVEFGFRGDRSRFFLLRLIIRSGEISKILGCVPNHFLTNI